MMDWGKLVNLAVGMGLGFSLGRLMAQRRLVNPRKPNKMVDSSNPVSIAQHVSPLLAPKLHPFQWITHKIAHKVN